MEESKNPLLILDGFRARALQRSIDKWDMNYKGRDWVW